MKKRKRGQVGRASREAPSFLHPESGLESGHETSFVPLSSTKADSGASTQFDRVLNAYVDQGRLVVVHPDENNMHGYRFSHSKAEYSCFLKSSETSDDMRRMLRNSSAVVAMKEEGEWLRVCWRDSLVRKKYCKALHDNGVWTYDGNVDPFIRWMLDHPSARVVPGRIGYLDLEADSRVPFSRFREMRILSWALVTEDAELCQSLEEDTDEGERWLLQSLWAHLEPVDQVAAWYGDGFDFPLLTARTLLRGLKPRFGRWLWLDHMALFEKMNTMAAESGDEKQSMALNAICNVVLGEEKLDLDASKTWDYWAAGGKDREMLKLYNLRDSQLMDRLERKTGYISLLNTLASACGIRPDSRGMLATVQVESLLQHLASERGMKFDTNVQTKRRGFDDAGAQFRGAYVMDPTERGIIRNVHVADFSSLYPSIIRTWNMSAETKCVPKMSPSKVIDDKVRRGQKPWPYDGECVVPITGIVFKTKPTGLLSGAVEEMMRLRKAWSDKKAVAVPGTVEWVDADRRSTAYKIAANSCYGAIGMASFRHHDRDVAESVSQAGVWLIKQTIAVAEERGLQVIYGDTDSLMVRGCTTEEFRLFVEWCNDDLYPRLLVLLGCEPGLIHLAYEKAFERIVLIAKKRYVGKYSHYKGTAATKDSKPEVKGLEYKRGDSIRLARIMQAAAVDLLVGPENGGEEDPALYVSLVREWRTRVMQEPLELDDVVVTKSLGKPLKDYATRIKKDGTAARQLPHIEVAKILQKRGRDVREGTRISYVIRNGKTKPIDVIPAEDWSGEVDREAVWESLVAPPTLRVLEAAFPGENWKPWSKAGSNEPDMFSASGG